MSTGLTTRQQQVLDYIRDEIADKGYPPSVREIGEALGLSSSSTVHSHLASLETKGFLRRDPSKPRALELLGDAAHTLVEPITFDERKVTVLPLVGRVAAGAPILAEQNVEDAIPLPTDVVGDSTSFLLRVQGDSMIDAGILDGDHVAVRQQSTAANGDIVVAMVEEEATVKRFFKEADRIRLQPENSSMDPIYARDVVILGKVVALFRTIR